VIVKILIDWSFVLQIMEHTYDCAATVYNHFKEATIWMREMKLATAPDWAKYKGQLKSAMRQYKTSMRTARLKKSHQAAEKKLLEQLIAEKIQLSVRAFFFVFFCCNKCSDLIGTCLSVKAESCSDMFRLGREHLRKVAEYIKECNQKGKTPEYEVLFDAQAVVIMFTTVLSGGTRREVAAGLDVNLVQFQFDDAGNVTGCHYTIPFEKTSPERAFILLPRRLAVILYFHVKVLRPLLLKLSRHDGTVSSFWIGPKGRALRLEAWSESMGRATLALSGYRILPMQFRRLFISMGLQVIPQLFGVSPQDASELLAKLCRTSPAHIWRYYNLLNPSVENRDALEQVLDHAGGLDHLHSENDDLELNTLTTQLVRCSVFRVFSILFPFLVIDISFDDCRFLRWKSSPLRVLKQSQSTVWTLCSWSVMATA
jgi:hypothetical protein